MEVTQPPQERRSFPIENITPEGIELIEKLLPDWERTSGDEMLYGYRTGLDDKNWRLSFDPRLKRVAFSEEKPTLMSPKFEMRNVEKVEVDQQTDEIDFVNKSGIIYRVSQKGLQHNLISPDSEVIVSLSL